MSESGSTSIANKNAADAFGDMSFIFGTKGWPQPRGVERYYHDGVIAVNHVSVSSWGEYLQCNHLVGSTKYTCKCPYHHAGPCHDLKRAGQVRNKDTGGHVWYSFPAAGKGTYWDYDHGNGCSSIEVKASCVIDALSSHAGCKGICGTDSTKCVDCVNKLSDTEKEHVWNEYIWTEGYCTHLRRRRSKVQNPTGNTSAAMLAIAPPSYNVSADVSVPVNNIIV